MCHKFACGQKHNQVGSIKKAVGYTSPAFRAKSEDGNIHWEPLIYDGAKGVQLENFTREYVSVD